MGSLHEVSFVCGVLRKDYKENSCTQCEAMAFHFCRHSRHLFTMAECPNHNSVVDATVELLAANTTEAIDLMDSYSRNYKNKIQAKMTPAVSESVSSVIDSVHFTLLLA